MNSLTFLLFLSILLFELAALSSVSGQELQGCRHKIIDSSGNRSSIVASTGLFLEHGQTAFIFQNGSKCRHTVSTALGIKLKFMLPNQSYTTDRNPKTQIRFNDTSEGTQIRITEGLERLGRKPPIDYFVSIGENTTVKVSAIGCVFSEISDIDQVTSSIDGKLYCIESKANVTLNNNQWKPSNESRFSDPHANCTDEKWTGYNVSCSGRWTCTEKTELTDAGCKAWTIADNTIESRSCTDDNTDELASFEFECTKPNQCLSFGGMKTSDTSAVVQCDKQIKPAIWKYRNETVIDTGNDRKFSCEAA